MSETRTYRGSSLEELLPRIRAELGDDAVVVRQREGLTGGVAGFFQRRTVEIEARRGQSSLGVDWFAGEPEDEAVVTPSPRFIARDAATQASGPAPEPGQEPAQPRPPESEVVAAAVASQQAAEQPAPARAQEQPPPPEQPPRRPTPFAAYLSAAETQPEPAPSPAANGVPESVPSALAGDAFPNAEELMRDALRSRATEPPPAEPIVTSPQVDAIPPTEPDRPEPPPSIAGWRPPSADVVAAVARPQAARHLAGVLASRGLDAELAGRVVDDALLHRIPLDPMSTLAEAVAAQLAALIPVGTLSGPAPRTLVMAGAPGSGAPRLVAGIAAAYASRTTAEVACIALRTPDGGAALGAALAPLGVPVHVAAGGVEAATHIRMLGHEALVLVDTGPVSVEDAAGLAGQLAALGEHELHLAIGPGGGPTAASLIKALRPQRIALGDPTDPLHLGAALQAAIDTGCPVTFVAGAAAPGRPDLAVHPADAFALARTLTA